MKIYSSRVCVLSNNEAGILTVSKDWVCWSSFLQNVFPECFSNILSTLILVFQNSRNVDMALHCCNRSIILKRRVCTLLIIWSSMIEKYEVNIKVFKITYTFELWTGVMGYLANLWDHIIKSLSHFVTVFRTQISWTQNWRQQIP